MATIERKRVRVEISEETIARLLACGQLCAADLHCLDGRSKQCVLKIVLNACRSFRSMGQAMAGNR